MTIEIRNSELEALILRRMEQGGFQDIEDVLLQALQESPAINGRWEKSDDQRTGAELIKALQASPHRELDIEPCRIRSEMPLRDVNF